MKLLVTLSLLLTCIFPAAAAPEEAPATSHVGDAEFPRIHPDLRVTFRLKAPGARQFKLEGGARLVKEPLELTLAEARNWTVTTPPAVPGFHYYWFLVEGLRVNDPARYAWFGRARETSGIEIPGPDSEFQTARENVPHGAVRMQWYFSKITGKWRKAHVYTPPGYEQGTDRYPVLYPRLFSE